MKRITFHYEELQSFSFTLDLEDEEFNKEYLEETNACVIDKVEEI